jgi:hypothetical protein
MPLEYPGEGGGGWGGDVKTENIKICIVCSVTALTGGNPVPV